MQTVFKESLWNQYGAALDTLAYAIDNCPDAVWISSLWKDPDAEGYGQFWFLAYHTVFWTDLYLAGYNEGFKPPAPFLRGKLPEQPYARADVRKYLADCREKCRLAFAGMTDEKASQHCVYAWVEASYYEMQIYALRHVQEHTAELLYILGQHGVEGEWFPKPVG